jgi:hypothetical protein
LSAYGVFLEQLSSGTLKVHLKYIIWNWYTKSRIIKGSQVLFRTWPRFLFASCAPWFAEEIPFYVSWKRRHPHLVGKFFYVVQNILQNEEIYSHIYCLFYVLSVPDDGYLRNASCALSLISTFSISRLTIENLRYSSSHLPHQYMFHHL